MIPTVSPTVFPAWYADEHQVWTLVEDVSVPDLAAIWERALSLPLTDPNVFNAFGALQRVREPNAWFATLKDALNTFPPSLILVDGPGHSAYASHLDGVIRLRWNIAMALDSIGEYKDTLSFFILSLILHEMGHYVFRVFNGITSESDENVQFGGFFGSAIGRGELTFGESGYYIEGLLWGGTICAGVESPPGELYVKAAEDLNWHRIRTISICPRIDSREHMVVLLGPSLTSRLVGPYLQPFTRDEVAQATRLDDVSTHNNVLAQSRGNFNNMEPGDRFLFNKLPPSKDLRLVAGEAHACTSSCRPGAMPCSHTFTSGPPIRR